MKKYFPTLIMCIGFQNFICAIVMGLVISLSPESMNAQDFTTGLVGHWPLDGNANDVSGNTNHATPIGGVSYGVGCNGAVNAAAILDGSTGYLIIAQIAPYQFGLGDFSLSLWFKSNASGIMVLWSSDTYPKPSIGAYINGAGLVETRTAPTQSNPISTAYSDNNWHHLVYTRNGVVQNVFIDGGLATQNNYTPIINVNTDFLISIGFNNPNYPYWFAGSVDNYRLYNRALLPADISALYKHEITPSPGSYTWDGSTGNGIASTRSIPNSVPGSIEQDTAQVRSQIRKAAGLIKIGAVADAAKILEEARQVLLQTKDTLTPIFADLLYTKALCLKDIQTKMSRYDEAADILDALIKHYATILGRPREWLPKLYRLKGHSLYLANRYEEAIEPSEKALQLYAEWHGEASTISPLTCLSLSYARLGDYEKSIFYTFKVIEVCQKVQDEHVFRIDNMYNVLGVLYKNTGDYEKSLYYHNLGIQLREKEVDSLHFTLCIPYSSRGNTQKRLGLFDEALADILKSRRIAYHNWKDSDFPDHAMTFLNAADVLRLQKKYPEAIRSFEKGIELYKHFKNEANSVGECYYGLAEVYIEMQDFEQTRSCLKQAEAYNNYHGGQRFEAVTDIYQLLKVFRLHNQNYLAAYQRTGQTALLDSAYAAGQTCLDILDFWRGRLALSEGRSRLVGTNYPVYEGILQTLKTLKTTGLRDTTDREAFAVVEQCKSLELAEAVKNTQVWAFGSVPPAFLEAEKQIQRQLDKVEQRRQRLFAQGAAEGDSALVAASASALGWQLKKDSLQQVMALQYGDYFRLRHANQRVSLRTLQTEVLRPDQTLLQYFVGDSSIFVFLVRPDYYEMSEIKKDFPLDTWVASLRASLTDKKESAADVFADIAHQLYQKLVQPFEAKLTKNLLISPDGILSYIPFDVLLTEAPDKAVRFQTHPYWLRKHAISYCFSATLLRDMQQKQHRQPPTLPIVAYAPFFDGDTTVLAQQFDKDPTMRRDLAPLPSSGKEAVGTARLMGGKAVTGFAATESSFRELAPQARLIHLATHGKAYDKGGDYSFLAFSPIKDSLENELLYARDLYNMTLNADMVVLSACESGLGKLKRGEGVISLARAFAYAGAKSVFTSLWAVNDEKTMELMLLFYKNIKKGMDKSEALQAAKLTFIEKQSHTNAHPFYWAAFIGIGDMRPIR